MALSATVLASDIESAIKSAFPDNFADESGQVGKLAQAIADSVVNHIKSAATVTTTTTCGAGAGTGTGAVS